MEKVKGFHIASALLSSHSSERWCRKRIRVCNGIDCRCLQQQDMT